MSNISKLSTLPAGQNTIKPTDYIKITRSEEQIYGDNLLGQPNGLATLDGTGKVPSSQLPINKTLDSRVAYSTFDASNNRFPEFGSNNSNNPTKFKYSEAKEQAQHTTKNSIQRLPIVNAWASAINTKDEIASKVDDFVREIQTAGRWNDFTDILICASNKVTDFFVPLKGTANFSNNGFTNADCSLEQGFGDISNINKSISLPYTSYTIDCGAFLTTPIQGSLFGSYGSPSANFNQELGLSMPEGLVLDPKGYGRNIREISATSGWIRGSHNGAALYCGFSNSLMVQTTNYSNSSSVAGADFVNVNKTNFLYSQNPSVSNDNKAGQFKIRILCYNNVGLTNTETVAIANNKIWSDATHKLDLALRSLQGNALAVIGDSITSGYVYRDRDSIVPQIEINTSIKALGFGRSGNPIRPDASRNMVGMLQDYIDNVRPLVQKGIVKYICWASGANDMGYRANLPGGTLNNTDSYLQEQTRIAVELCINTAITDGISIENQSLQGTLSSISGGFGDLRNPVDRGIEQAGINTEVRYIPNWEIGKSQPILSQTSWFGYNGSSGDSAHPLPTGMRFFANNFIHGNPKYSKIQKGDTYVITQNGMLGGSSVSIGDKLIALVNEPTQNPNNWRIERQSKSTFVGQLIANPAGYNQQLTVSTSINVGGGVTIGANNIDINLGVGLYTLYASFFGDVNNGDKVQIQWMDASDNPLPNARAAILQGYNANSTNTPKPYAEAEIIVTSPTLVRLKTIDWVGNPAIYAGGSKIKIQQL